LALFFAFVLGRVIAKARRKEPKVRITGWAIRFVLVMSAVSWRGGLDRITMVALLVSAIGLALGFTLENRPRKQEDLTDVIFPHDQP
jgi:hypothetical protein